MLGIKFVYIWGGETGEVFGLETVKNGVKQSNGRKQIETHVN